MRCYIKEYDKCTYTYIFETRVKFRQDTETHTGIVAYN